MLKSPYLVLLAETHTHQTTIHMYAHKWFFSPSSLSFNKRAFFHSSSLSLLCLWCDVCPAELSSRDSLSLDLKTETNVPVNLGPTQGKKRSLKKLLAKKRMEVKMWSTQHQTWEEYEEKREEVVRRKWNDIQSCHSCRCSWLWFPLPRHRWKHREE